MSLKFDQFVRSNPRSDRFEMRAFHHVEFICGDAQTTAARWAQALGLKLVARSDLTTGNTRFASHVLASGAIRFVFTAPTSESPDLDPAHPTSTLSPARMHDYLRAHGLSAVAIALSVADAGEAFERAVANGAIGVTPPRSAPDAPDVVVSEVLLHRDGDARLRFVADRRGAAHGAERPFLPGYAHVGVPADAPPTFGFTRLDHAVSNVAELLPAVAYLTRALGLHEFAEFGAGDVGTVNSGLNSMVLASNNELVLLPLNEPTHGGSRKSQIQTYLEQHRGPGLQHLALKCNDIFHTVSAMREAAAQGAGFALMERPRAEYYRALRGRLGDEALSAEQAARCESLGILADRDEQGVLLQVFTKPVGDRATLFLEIIQRIGCEDAETAEQAAGCGGFGKGNFAELFRAIEDYETSAGINRIDAPAAVAVA